MSQYADGLQTLWKEITNLIRSNESDASKYVPYLESVAEQQAWFAKYGPEAKRVCNATKDVMDKAKKKTEEKEKKSKKATK